MALDIQTLAYFNNRLLNRQELTLLVSHPAQSFKKADLATVLKKKYNSNYVIIHGSRTEFGTCQTRTVARIYESKEQFEKIEDWFVLMREGMAKKDKEARRVRKDKRKRRVASWGSARRQEKKAERKQK